jgi:hypothetical protein
MNFGIPLLILVISLVAICFVWARNGLTEKRDTKGQKKLDRLVDVASNHVQVNGVLAGVSITLIVLLSALRDNRCPTTLEEMTISLLIIAFFGYAGTGLLFSVTLERENEQRFLLFALASSLYYLSAVTSFTALVPLVRVMEYQNLRPLVVVLVAGVVFGGYLAVATHFYNLLSIKKSVLGLGMWSSGLFLIAALGELLDFPVAESLGLATWLGVENIQSFVSIALPYGGVLVCVVFLICMISSFDKKLLCPEICFITFLFISLACSYVAMATCVLSEKPDALKELECDH